MSYSSGAYSDHPYSGDVDAGAGGATGAGYPALRSDVLRRARLEADRREREEERARAFRESVEDAAAKAAARIMEARLKAQAEKEDRMRFRALLRPAPIKEEDRMLRRTSRQVAPMRAPRPSPRSLSAAMAGVAVPWEV